MLMLPGVFISLENSQLCGTEPGAIWMSSHQEGHLYLAGLAAYLGIYSWPSYQGKV